MKNSEIFIKINWIELTKINKSNGKKWKMSIKIKSALCKQEYYLSPKTNLPKNQQLNNAIK